MKPFLMWVEEKRSTLFMIWMWWIKKQEEVGIRGCVNVG